MYYVGKGEFWGEDEAAERSKLIPRRFYVVVRGSLRLAVVL
jgi:hypothetical protein